jgi:hypothetical protein
MSGKTMKYPVDKKNPEHGREDTRNYQNAQSLRPGPKRSPGDYDLFVFVAYVAVAQDLH